MYPNFPFQAIREAAAKGEYTITDKGTWWAIESEARDKLSIFVSLPPAIYTQHMLTPKSRPKEKTTKTTLC